MSLTRPSWDYPACPDCETDVFVDELRTNKADSKFHCHFCEAGFGGDSR